MEDWLIVIAALGILILCVLGAQVIPTAPPANAKKTEMGEFTREQVAQHNTRDDLWIILKLDGVSRVYDVTSYIDEHPGGDAILDNAGADSTALFTGPQHPPRVHDMIEDFCIGTLLN